eukprot:scaffold3027_cov31-Tisochrysis_lutea.AAC.1
MIESSLASHTKREGDGKGHRQPRKQSVRRREGEREGGRGNRGRGGEEAVGGEGGWGKGRQRERARRESEARRGSEARKVGREGPSCGAAWGFLGKRREGG